MTDGVVPGEVITGDGAVRINEDRETTELRVANRGDRPVQVGSHCHFFEANAALAFDREAAFGMRLNVPAGTAVRFEPGEAETVELVAIGGKRRARGTNGLVNGSVDADPGAAVARAREQGFADTGAEEQTDAEEEKTDPGETSDDAEGSE